MFTRYVAAFLFFSFVAPAAFSQATETEAKLQGVSRPAIAAQYDYRAADVSDAIVDRLKQDGLVASSQRGLIQGTGILPAISADSISLYFRVDGQKRKGRDISRVYLFLSNRAEGFASISKQGTLARNAQNYLGGLRRDINAYCLGQQINRQQKSVDDKAGDYKKLLKSEHKLESKRYDLKRDLSSETDAQKQDKIRKKIEKLDRNISRQQADIGKSERELQQQKDQLKMWQEQLQTEKTQ